MLMNLPIDIITIIGLSLNRVRELRNLVQQARQKVGHARQQSQHRKEQVELNELKHIASNL